MRVIHCAAASLAFLFTSSVYGQERTSEIDAALAARMEQEKAARAGCKEAICKLARSGKKGAADIKCDVVKTWPEAELKDKILKGKVNWPWGHAQCTVQINLSADMIAAAGKEAS